MVFANRLANAKPDSSVNSFLPELNQNCRLRMRSIVSLNYSKCMIFVVSVYIIVVVVGVVVVFVVVVVVVIVTLSINNDYNGV